MIKRKELIIPRDAFESSGWRVIELARGEVQFPDGRHCRFNIRLRADQGAEGDIHIVAEDMNRDTAIKTLRLKRKNLIATRFQIQKTNTL